VLLKYLWLYLLIQTTPLYSTTAANTAHFLTAALKESKMACVTLCAISRCASTTVVIVFAMSILAPCIFEETESVIWVAPRVAAIMTLEIAVMFPNAHLPCEIILGATGCATIGLVDSMAANVSSVVLQKRPHAVNRMLTQILK
jgi:exosortase/archaeosortase